MNLSNNNFKDDFEKNRQSIDPKEHQDNAKDSVNGSVDNVKEEVSDKTDEQFPPRNAQRRQRRRDTATN
ncbi:MAG: elastin-binding protein EbpS, partial [Staphylococcus equorum]